VPAANPPDNPDVHELLKFPLCGPKCRSFLPYGQGPDKTPGPHGHKAQSYFDGTNSADLPKFELTHGALLCQRDEAATEYDGDVSRVSVWQRRVDSWNGSLRAPSRVSSTQPAETS